MEKVRKKMKKRKWEWKKPKKRRIEKWKIR